MKLGYLAFDATRTAANDVDFPLDVVRYPVGSYEIVHHRFEESDLLPVSKWWQREVVDLVERLPDEWMADMNGGPPGGTRA